VSIRFRKRQIPHNWLPVGTDRINAYGYLEVKTENPKTWKTKHCIVWETVNGRKVPGGGTIIFADGDRLNLRPENLLFVTRGELAVMNKYGLISGATDF